MRRACAMALAAVLAIAVAAPARADSSTQNSKFVAVTWGTPAVPVGDNWRVQFWSGRRTGTPDYQGNVGVQYNVGFSSMRSYCDTATDTLVQVGIHGPLPAGWAYVDPAVWTLSRQGARVEAVLDLWRTTYRRPDCDRPGPVTWVREELGPATLIAEFEVTGAWERHNSCWRSEDLGILSRGTSWATTAVAASLRVSGPVDLEALPSAQLEARLSESQSVSGLPDRGQPWECFPG